jgi:hypothetical protein
MKILNFILWLFSIACGVAGVSALADGEWSKAAAFLVLFGLAASPFIINARGGPAMKPSPRYTHDCEKCIYLGQHEESDPRSLK